MSQFLFVGGPFHGRVEDIYSNSAIEPVGSTELRVSVGDEVVIYERSDFSRWNGPHYRVAVANGASELIPQTIDEMNYHTSKISPIPKVTSTD
ncbi:hypothetical protein [Escherichia albertii]|uniref:hypothetical protein n=1 Tax=Escherichia albertii TaxID=208962 RepID=UPI0009301F6C|nr:hypothetical protein [Escherichia albertii]EHX2143637.1 hypothetical protein [Escherichia albertii]MCZ8859122.1 hypothetical protein [Escherichia albertii]WDB84142.1 hypothetical protein PS033_01985 [Escherichia albertii]